MKKALVVVLAVVAFIGIVGLINYGTEITNMVYVEARVTDVKEVGIDIVKVTSQMQEVSLYGGEIVPAKNITSREIVSYFSVEVTHRLVIGQLLLYECPYYGNSKRVVLSECSY